MQSHLLRFSRNIGPRTKSLTRSPYSLNILARNQKFFVHVDRNPEFSRVTPSDVEYFESVIDNSNQNAILVSSDSQELESYNTCWIKKYKGQSKLVLKPKSTQEVSDILSHCNSRHLAVNVQAGNTSLVGGSVPVFDEIILSTSRLNRILKFDEIAGIITLEAGCVLQDVDQYLRLDNDHVPESVETKHSIPHVFPLDLGAKGSCQIGGNIGTNAGGLRLVRFGNLHGNVLGLEVVLADGTVLDLMSESRKDNTGYDMKQLFIGSEGTLGVVTKACILCPKLCSAVNVLFLSVNSFEDVLRILSTAKIELHEILSAIEFLDDRAISQPIDHLGVAYPLSQRSSFYMVIETSGSNEQHDRQKLESFVEGLFDKELINDGCIAEHAKQSKLIWSLREGIAAAVNEAKLGCYKYDISLPLAKMYDIVAACRRRVVDCIGEEAAKNVDVMGYGHLGDGNLHVNVTVDQFKPEYEQMLEPWMFEWVASVNGSVSAEHGIGVHKPQYLHFSKSGSAIRYMKQIKQLFDPNQILTPYKVLPVSDTQAQTKQNLN